MNNILGIIVSVIIGILYNIFVQKIGETFSDNERYSEKTKRILVICFIGAIIGFLLAKTLFTSNKKFKNKIMRYGLYIGSALLLFQTLFCNWHMMDNDVKMFVLLIVMGIFIWIAYSSATNDVSSTTITMQNLLPAAQKYDDIDFDESFDDEDE